MKIVANDCYGGFSLSDEATKEYEQAKLDSVASTKKLTEATGKAEQASIQAKKDQESAAWAKKEATELKARTERELDAYRKELNGINQSLTDEKIAYESYKVQQSQSLQMREGDITRRIIDVEGREKVCAEKQASLSAVSGELSRLGNNCRAVDALIQNLK